MKEKLDVFLFCSSSDFRRPCFHQATRQHTDASTRGRELVASMALNSVTKCSWRVYWGWSFRSPTWTLTEVIVWKKKWKNVAGVERWLHHCVIVSMRSFNWTWMSQSSKVSDAQCHVPAHPRVTGKPPSTPQAPPKKDASCGMELWNIQSFYFYSF